MTDIQAKLITELKNMFQFDQSELDFGVYRIMAMKRAEITRFLETDLPAQIHEGLAELTTLARSTETQQKIEEIERSCAALGMDVQATPRVEEYNRLKAELADAVDVTGVERDIYSHLYEFFSRYYDEGDFISQRRYKDGVYAIPYEGEEVKLHWANADQYYVKTSEYFRDYTFKDATGRVCRFKLVDAETERDNNKAKAKRLFQLRAETPFEIDGNNITIFLEFKAGDKKQDAYIADILEAFRAAAAQAPAALWVLTAREGKTELERQLNRYTAKNTFDYFIHKDLAGFLNRELDFYIKSEVFYIDDVDEQSFAHTRTYITKAKVLRTIARKIIEFLAQIENFQKKLYLKKKFVVETNYCITLDRIPEAFYPEIAANDAQREEWVRLFAIDGIDGNLTQPSYSAPLTADFLKANPFLVLDTAFFGVEFKERLIATIDKLDESLDGLLIHSENFQALRLLEEKYKRKVKCVYIDPPYNSPQSEILYKNSFKHSSWLALMDSRLQESTTMLTEDGSTVIAIDKYEHNNLYDLCLQLFPSYDVVSVAIEHNKKGTQGDHFSFSNEYAIFCVSQNLKELNEVMRAESDWEYSNFRNWGGESERGDAANCFYPVYVKYGAVIGYGAVLDDAIHPSANETIHGEYEYYTPDSADVKIGTSNDDIIAVYPIDDEGVERKWRYAFQTMGEIYEYLKVETSRGGNLQIKMPKYSDQFKTLWSNPIYNAGDNGTTVLTSLGFVNKEFEYPKSIFTVRDCVFAVSGKNDYVLDYFAGSGTTAHAVINLNRADEGQRKYILVEMGEYFNTATKPRVVKAIYCNDHKKWDNGKPAHGTGASHAFKYLRLESYEDTLGNIQLPANGGATPLGEEYLLKYMLNMEADGQALLPIAALEKPFDYELNITRNNESKVTVVDLPETFNYLVGLTVVKSHARVSLGVDFATGQHGALAATLKDGDTYTFKAIEGTLPNNDNALIIWRTLTGDIQKDNAVLEAYRATFTGRYRKVLVNGDCNLENASLIEEEIKLKMFEEV